MQNQSENRAYAGFFVRFAAFLVDSLIAALAAGALKLPFAVVAMTGAGFIRSNFIFQYSLLDVAGYLGAAAYFVLLTYFSHSTLGKMLFHLEVVVTDGEWTFINILYRETVGRFLSSLLCIGYLAVLVQPKKQGFHDMLCDTCVVYKNMVAVPAVSLQPAAAGQGAVAAQWMSGQATDLGQPVPEQGESVTQSENEQGNSAEIRPMSEQRNAAVTPSMSEQGRVPAPSAEMNESQISAGRSAFVMPESRPIDTGSQPDQMDVNR